MANTFTNAAAEIPTAATPVSLYTASGAKGVVHALSISNTGLASIKVNIVVNVGGTDYSLGTNIPISPEATLIWDKPINLNDTDILKVVSDTDASTTAFASILEIS